VEWQPGRRLGAACAALGLPVPEMPFPHVNSTAETRAQIGLDPLPYGLESTFSSLTPT
jgi:hypothetical protein